MKTKDKRFKTLAIKAEARELVNRRGVYKNSMVFFLLFLPLFILNIFSRYVGVYIPGAFMGVISFVVELVCWSAFILSVGNLVNHIGGKPKFKLHNGLYSIFILIVLGIQVLAQFTLGSLFGMVFFLIVSVLFLVVCIPIIFLAAIRNYPLQLAVREGFKLGNQYFWPILKMFISFIPLLILCGITFGIVFIFKGTYIATSFGILSRNIFEDARLF